MLIIKHRSIDLDRSIEIDRSIEREREINWRNTERQKQSPNYLTEEGKKEEGKN